MSFEFILHSIAQKVFTDELLGTLLAEDQKTANQRDNFLQDWVYQEKKAALAQQLTPDQAAELETLEGLRRASLRALALLAVESGLYTGFQQALTQQPAPSPFLSSASHDALDDPQICPGYFKKRLEAEALVQQMRGHLPGSVWSLVADVDVIWSDREYGVAVQGFRLGLQAALQVLTTLGPQEILPDSLASLRQSIEELS